MQPGAMAHLRVLVRDCDWFMRVLTCVRDERIPKAWVGAGALRDLVWGELYGPGFSPANVRDIDVAFFDPGDLSRAYDDHVTHRLSTRCPELPWQAHNQAAVHTWYASRFGGDPPTPLTSIDDAIGTWPETATAVAVRLGEGDVIQTTRPGHRGRRRPAWGRLAGRSAENPRQPRGMPAACHRRRRTLPCG
jgi:uncharacterized protein